MKWHRGPFLSILPQGLGLWENLGFACSPAVGRGVKRVGESQALGRLKPVLLVVHDWIRRESCILDALGTYSALRGVNVLHLERVYAQGGIPGGRGRGLAAAVDDRRLSQISKKVRERRLRHARSD